MTRLATVGVFLSSEHAVASDVKYYWAQLDVMFHGGSAATTLREYPLPAMATMLVQFAVTYAHRSAFEVIFVASTLAADALLTRMLWKSSEPGAAWALWFWIALVPLLGPVALFRFDMFPATLTAAALIVLTSRPGRAGAMLGFATAIKAWPVLVLASIARPRRSRAAVAWWYGAFVVVGGVVTAAAAGMHRLVSPWTWQSARGLQIESLAATPEMVLRRVHAVNHWPITLQFHAWQLAGPGTQTALVVSNALQVAAAVIVGGMYVRLYRVRGAASSAALRWVALASVLLFVIVNKTLSPQYLLWIAALLAVVLLGETDRRTHRFAQIVLLVAAASHAVFPWLYGRIIAGDDPGGIGVAILLARNVTLIALTWYATRTAFVAASINNLAPIGDSTLSAHPGDSTR